MKELLFGWLIKPIYKITTLDRIIGSIEFNAWTVDIIAHLFSYLVKE